MDILSNLSDRPNAGVNPDLLAQALEHSHGDSGSVSSFLNASLRTFINKIKLESMGYKETIFRLRRFDEIKKVYAKKIVQHEEKHDENTHLGDPNFCGLIYPSLLTEVFLTVKGNVVVQKSVARELHYCNGKPVSDTSYVASECVQNQCEAVPAPRVMDLIIHNQFDAIRKALPEPVQGAVLAAMNSRANLKILEQLDPVFLEEMEL